MDDVRLIATDRGDVGQRLDLVLQRHLRDVTAASRTRIQKWIESECVTVNQAPATRPSRRILHGDVVSISLPSSARRAVMAAEEIPLDVIYEDDYLVAINKPAGMVVHPTYRHPRGTLMNALLWHARLWPAAVVPPPVMPGKGSPAPPSTDRSSVLGSAAVLRDGSGRWPRIR